MFYICFDFNLQKFRKYTVKIKSIPFAVTPGWFDLKIHLCVAQVDIHLPRKLCSTSPWLPFSCHCHPSEVGCLMIHVWINPLPSLCRVWTIWPSPLRHLDKRQNPRHPFPPPQLRYLDPNNIATERTSGGRTGCLKNVTNISVEISCKCYLVL